MNRRNLLIACGTALTLAAAVFFTMKPDHSESAAAADYFDPSYSAVSWAQQAQLERSGLAQSWMDAVKAEINRRDYAFRQEGSDLYTASHAAQGLTFHISESGFLVSGADWDAELNLDAVYAGSLPVDAGDLIAVDLDLNKLVYHYEVMDVEYINDAKGMRQNFIVKDAERGDIRVEQQILTELETAIENNSLVLKQNGRNVYTYTDMKVWDNDGRILTASMHMPDSKQLALAVDASAATFPLTIDPVSRTYDWKVEGDNLNAGFGFWVAGNGDINGDGYDDVVIGAPEYTNTFAMEGAFFVYYGGPDGLPLTPDFVYYGGQEESGMGKCISIEGDVNGDGYSDVLVGQHQYSPPSDQGRALLFYGGPSGISSTPGWTFTAGRKKAKLGEAVTMAGDLNGDGYTDVCIGAHAWDNDEEMGDLGNKAGKFWVFHGGPSGLSTVPAMECVADVTDANLGVSMDRAGDVNGDGYDDLHVGGYIFLVGDGMICTFHGGPGGADGTPDFMAVGGAHDTSFYAVNLSAAGDVNGDGYDDVVIGAPRFDAGGTYQAGKLHLHLGGPSGLDTTIAWIVQGTQYDERFAFNVNDAHDLNADGYDDVLVTSKYFIPEGSTDSVGKTMIYLGGPNGPSLEPNWEFVGESTNGAGQNACLAGDVTGDGQEDIILSGSAYSGDLYHEGVVYGFYGLPYKCDPPVDFVVSGVSPTTATFEWRWVFGSTTYKLFIKELGSTGAPVSLNLNGNDITVTGLKPATKYQCYVKARCEDGYTNRSENIIISTPPMRTENNVIVEDPTIYPNPVRDRMNIDFGTNEGSATVLVYDMSGTLMIEKHYDLSQSRTVELTDMNAVPDGVYLVTLDINNVRTTKKITKTN